ncbi:hypothetical protein GW17_00044913 [Ensete ventricosum]|nr:hypothetical protein GW17_00044913 [Ensete ventricosum]
MGRPETRRSWCKRHPKHPQSTGVCPFCLRERLTRLAQCSSSSFVAYISSPWASSSSSSSGSDNPSSSASSPPRHPDMKRARVSFLLKRDTAATSALMKSRSLVVVVGSREDEEKEKETAVGKGKQKEKKDKFWSWLLSGPKRRQNKEGDGDSLHSQTFKEKPSAKWILFS